MPKKNKKAQVPLDSKYIPDQINPPVYIDFKRVTFVILVLFLVEGASSTPHHEQPGERILKLNGALQGLLYGLIGSCLTHEFLIRPTWRNLTANLFRNTRDNQEVIPALASQSELQDQKKLLPLLSEAQDKKKKLKLHSLLREFKKLIDHSEELISRINKLLIQRDIPEIQNLLRRTQTCLTQLSENQLVAHELTGPKEGDDQSDEKEKAKIARQLDNIDVEVRSEENNQQKINAGIIDLKANCTKVMADLMGNRVTQGQSEKKDIKHKSQFFNNSGQIAALTKAIASAVNVVERDKLAKKLYELSLRKEKIVVLLTQIEQSTSITQQQLVSWQGQYKEILRDEDKNFEKESHETAVFSPSATSAFTSF